ncbi:biopolymer transporter ExbD [Paracrocinitomix mangrovi]|uniref:ExbD/TolR family protein n=1 Tax=Paracrocinitomix mangrovi TaxID=2862509 RepID=UPI001C8E3573|nr:biopolymer transporter ExbD [Paracrocinitomix mangrovi]UKN03213.1 biopolymer transporter ExbD [Paracrocinitomix mangrovi]
MDLGRRNKVKAEGGMSSMTDLVFLLLIFFIIMATKVQPNVPVDLPKKSDLPPSSLNPSVVVGVTPNSLYYIEGSEEEYTFEEIVPILDSKMDEQTDKTLKVSGDRIANYEAVFNIIALAKQRDWKPVLAYEPGG